MSGVSLIAALAISLLGAEPLWPDLSKMPAAMGGGEKDVAVVVAIEDYFRLTPVTGAVELGAAWVRFFDVVLKVPNPVVLLNHEATADGIRDVVKAARQQLKPGGRFWFVFIGHGAPNEDGTDGILVGVTAQPTQREFFRNSVSRGEILALVGGGPGEPPPVLVIDACFSGTDVGGKALITDAMFAMNVQVLEAKEATVLTAGRSGDIAGSLPGRGGPAFSYLMLGALRGWGDLNGDGTVTAEEAVQYARSVLFQMDPRRQQQPQHSGIDQPLIGKKGRKLESGPDIVAIRLKLAGGVSAHGTGQTGTVDQQLEQIKAAQRAREEAERKERELKAAQQKQHNDEVERFWGEVRVIGERGGPEGKEAVELFLKKYATHPLGNPRAAEATAMLERFKPKPKPSDAQRGSGGSKGPTTLQWVYSNPAKLYFAKTETTLSQYRACVEAGACSKENFDTKTDSSDCNWGHTGRDDHPMNCVDWHGARQFCAWVDGRLPTWDEWYAEASNGGSRQYPWGDNEVTCDRAIWNATNAPGCGRDSTWPVCSKTAGNSVSGLCDMSGNVWEWTSTQETETGEGERWWYIVGGGWFADDPDPDMRATFSITIGAGFRWQTVGVRCVRVSQ